MPVSYEMLMNALLSELKVLVQEYYNLPEDEKSSSAKKIIDRLSFISGYKLDPCKPVLTIKGLTLEDRVLRLELLSRLSSNMPKEITVEKIRAIMTREGVELMGARDIAIKEYFERKENNESEHAGESKGIYGNDGSATVNS